MMKLETGKEVVEKMIKIYCKKNHHRKMLCNKCREVLEYAHLKSEKCPFKKTKTFCSNCSVHCYKDDMKNKIREIMRFSGPSMIFYHPVLTIKHLILSKRKGTA